MQIQPSAFALFAFLLSTGLALPVLAGSTAVSFALEMPGSDSDLDAEKKSVGLALDEIFAGKEDEALLGFTLHPEFRLGTDHDFVYVAHTYDSGRSKFVQYHWDAEAGTLGDPDYREGE